MSNTQKNSCSVACICFEYGLTLGKSYLAQYFYLLKSGCGKGNYYLYYEVHCSSFVCCFVLFLEKNNIKAIKFPKTNSSQALAISKLSVPLPPDMSRILSIDYGKKRTGIAVTDPLRIIASGLTTVPTHELFDFLKKYCAEEPVTAFVVGWPLGLDGLATDNTQPVAVFCKRLEKLFPDKKVYHQDERFTSKEAKLAILKSGAKKKKRQDKALVDKVAATIILQAFMEENRSIL